MSPGGNAPGADVVFCDDLTNLPERPEHNVPPEHRRYEMFMHEAEVFMLALAGAVEAGKLTPEQALREWEPYRSTWPLDREMMEEFEGGFPRVEWFTSEWPPGPGSEEFWRAADELGIPGVVYSEGGDHPGGSSYFYVEGQEALRRVCEALADEYRVVVLDIGEYDTSTSSDIERARRIIERGRREPGVAGGAG